MQTLISFLSSLKINKEGLVNRFIKIESDAPGISREHFSIFIKDDICIIRDLSRYGTFLNKERIKNETVLQIGDSLSIGSPVKEFILISEGNF